jgi:hypothetical protein
MLIYAGDTSAITGAAAKYLDLMAYIRWVTLVDLAAWAQWAMAAATVGKQREIVEGEALKR